MKFRLLGKIAFVAVLIGGGFFAGSILSSNADGLADPNLPGMAGDPIVTKSYVDEAVKRLVAQEVQKLQAGGGAGVSDSRMTVIELKPGQKLLAGPGAEFIVRNGRAVAISSDANGIPDLTAGADLLAGSEIPLNHLLLFPREGRGIEPHKEMTGTIYVMVRGPYSHWDKDGTLLK